MKRIAFLASSLTVAAVCYAVYAWGNATPLINLAAQQVGASKSNAIQSLGPPDRSYTYAAYRASINNIAASYEPDPADIPCDEVLEYRRGAAIILIFLADAKVMKIYKGYT